ncbi:MULTISPECIES: hypothetical protein [unclassified Ruegeria]|uniref:hypothetical protein n=1 Tax=unclassified Ruegeria TaxID=2625375 RepID=UPI001AE7868C|nr:MULTISPECIES: hypothetical protein [unclassified Ruegeria]
MTDPIVKTIAVSASAARAFDIFVNRIGTWWPLDSHAVSASQGQPARDVVIEPRIGGAVYEVMFDGTRADWGQVLAIDPADPWHSPGIRAPTRGLLRASMCVLRIAVRGRQKSP